jgi:hypothetical protein
MTPLVEASTRRVSQWRSYNFLACSSPRSSFPVHFFFFFAAKSSRSDRKQGCQIVYFRTKSPDLGKLWKALYWKKSIYVFNGHLEYFTDIWDILRPFGTYILC